MSYIDTNLWVLFNIFIFIFFSTQFNNNNKQKNSKPCGLGWTYVMGWVGFGWVEIFLTHYGGLGQKIPLTQPNLTHAHP